MLQAIRNNPDSALFYVEYFRFEANFLKKIKLRQQILQNKNNDPLEFVDEEEEAPLTKIDSSSKILEIVFEQIQEKFSNRWLVFCTIWKDLVKPSDFIDEGFKTKVKQVYAQKKQTLSDQYLDYKLTQIKERRFVAKKLS